MNPATSVRGAEHVVTKGAPPVLTPAETRSLLDRIDTATVVGLRDRAPGAAEPDGVQLRAGERDGRDAAGRDCR